MGMTVGIKSSGDRHLDLHFSSSNYDGNGKWGSLHISICAMHSEGGQDMPLQSLQCELEHADIDRLIQELQTAKGMLAGDDLDFFKDAAVWREPESLFAESKRRELFVRIIGSRIVPCDQDGNPCYDAICAQCGFKWNDHAYSGACIEKLPMGMIRFSKTERFRA